MIERLKDILEHHKFLYWKILRQPQNRDLLEFIDNWSEKLANNSLPTKIFWVLHDIHDFPTCKECGKPLTKDTDINHKLGCYHTYCSNRCLTKNSDRNEKRKNTNIARYGFLAPVMNEEIKKKIAKTNIDRYGTASSFSSEDIKNKIKETNIRRYGVEHASQNEDIKSKIVNTCMERYGTTNGGCSIEALKKIENTNRERYGVKSSFDRKEVREKSKETLLRKYGVSSYLKSEDSIRFRTGSSSKSYYETLLNNEYDEPLFSIDEYIESHSKDRYAELNFKCKKCGNVFSSFHINGIHKRCPKCYPKNENFEENELLKFLKSIYKGEIIHGVGGRQVIYPLELDFYLPEKKIAFEFDGLYWHSEKNGKGSTYHLHKTEECENKGIQLIHIFEDEWIYKRDIVKNRIRNLLGVYEHTVYARKCTVRQIDRKTTREFLDMYHIQGKCVSKENLGLFFNDELVSVMTFGKSRFNKKYEWELLRFCNKFGYHVIGGAGKLLKHFERTYRPNSMISYADRRWSVGNLYRKLGFAETQPSKPAYFYIKGQNRFSRIQFQKHKLSEKLEVFDENLSESDNMSNNGFYRIYDCGNRVFTKVHIQE